MSSRRAPRADAQRNRQRVLDVAEQVFAEEGKSAGLLDIAARAGVGAGTVYRHFPTKEALYAAVISARLTELLDLVPDLPDDPPGTRIVEFWRLAVQQVRENVALCELVTTGQRLDIDPDVGQRYLATLGELVDRARDAGRLRENLTTADVISMLAAAATAEARDHDAPPGRLADLISASIFT
ncbi:TetR/AcrR family transcriptional regulator [Nocardia sienata]|uniref:TetR/AcrR family transcriptional regulator n=1 Tax=Nocardia sienata TaxID=248552 RepID=UPI000A050A13|nr:TetR/AcrR family transcriptional regulator [Nocardia sienata]